MTGWWIRDAAPADREAVSECLLAAGIGEWGPFLGEARIRAANEGRVHPADLVAEDESGVFGFVSWEAATGEITRLYVHPRGQRRGAGGALLARAVEALREAGRSEAWLNTEERAAGACAFYEREGWRREGPPRVRDWHGARLVEPRYVMPLGSRG